MKLPLKTHLQLFCAAIFALVFASACGTTNVELPKGSSKGYSTARFAKTDFSSATETDALEDSPVVNAAIQDAIRSNFRARGVAFGEDSADLIVAYMIIRQNAASTSMNSDHFGNGRDAWAIIDEAHERGVIENKRPDDFEAGAIVIDVIDAQTNKLVFRNFAKRDLIADISEDMRRQRINEAVGAALSPFFK